MRSVCTRKDDGNRTAVVVVHGRINFKIAKCGNAAVLENQCSEILHIHRTSVGMCGRNVEAVCSAAVSDNEF